MRTLKKELEALESDIESAFKATEKHLKDKNLAKVIKDRHAEAVRQFGATKVEFAALHAALERAEDKASDAETDAALSALSAFFDTHSQTRKRAPLEK